MSSEESLPRKVTECDNWTTRMRSLFFASIALTLTVLLKTGPVVQVREALLPTPIDSERPIAEAVAVLVVGSESREEVVVIAAKSLTEHVITPLKSKYTKVVTTYCLSELAPSTRPQLLIFGSTDESDILSFKALGQFERLEICFNKVSEKHGNFSYYVKTRPDLVWLEDMSLSFRREAIMTRARRISQGRITMQHLSWPVGCDCEEPGCVMVDDIFAIIPFKWKQAYFIVDSALAIAEDAENFTEMPEKIPSDENRLFYLTNDWQTKCPCATHWAEGQLTGRLAQHEATVLIHAFNVVLAPPTKDGKYWRQGKWGVRTHVGDDWLDCG